MTGLAIDGLILFICSVYVVTQYRILPVAGTPYWLFGILFFLLTVNFFIKERWKSFLFWMILAIVLVGPMVTAIADRHKTAPVYGVHDIILQQEAAMRYLLDGKNPYKETYFNTPVASFNYDEPGNTNAVNPALYHFVMPPWYVLFPILLYGFMIPVFGFFDGRVALLFCMVGLIFIILRWFKNKTLGRLAVILIALGPGFVQYFLEGRSDMFALFWFVWSIYLLEKKKLFWSGILFALALLSKQTIWFAVPFYFAYQWHKEKRLNVLVVAGTFLLFTVPFLLWDAKAFIDSVILYLSGGTATGYPISGYGLGMVLYEFGIIKDIHAYYPFILWQIGLGVPAIVYFIRYIAKHTWISRMLIGYAVTLMVVWYVSRYFNNSHLSYIGSIFILGVLKEEDEK